MSTNHTPNYNLSQWEAGDQVLRTEFNEDNAKLDAALAEKASTVRVEEVAAANCLYRLIDYTVPANTPSVELSLPDGLVTQYAAIIVCAQLGTNDYKIYAGMQVNSKNQVNYELRPFSAGNILYCPSIPMGEGGDVFIPRAAILHGRLNDTQLSGIVLGDYTQYRIFAHIPYSEVTKFTFFPIEQGTYTVTSGYIRAGSRIRIFGLK